MDLLAHVPSWDDIERNLDHRFSELNQSVSSGWQSAHDNWDGFTRRVSNGASQAYGAMGGHRIDNVRQAMALSYPIMQMDLSRKWASINIGDILPVLLKLVQEVVLILGGSVAVGGAIGGAVGSLAFGAGALPGAMAGGGIGLQVGNLILMGLGLAAIAEYFYEGLPACLSTLQEGLATAWTAEDGVKPAGLDPSGGSAALIQERTERAARQLAHGQEQLVLLLLTAIVTYLTRGQMKAGVMNSMESIATRSAKLQAQISNKEFASWLAKNQSKILAEPELQIKDVTPLRTRDSLADPVPQATTKPLPRPEEEVQPLNPVKSVRPDQYDGVKAASSYLKEQGVPRAFRKQVLESFEIETINVRPATETEFGLRYFDGVNAQAKGRYLFETFPATRESLAVKTEWNQMTHLAQFKVSPGATLIEGRASSQGVGLSGGQIQKYILNLSDLTTP
jgi:hypothetical protein